MKRKEMLWEKNIYADKLHPILAPATGRGTKHYLINNFLKPSGTDVLLDIGCGYGQNILSFYESVGLAVGIDISPSAIRAAKRAAKISKAGNLKFFTGDANRIKLASGSFDKIICFDVAEHLVKPESLFREIARLLKSGGKALVYTNYYGYFCWGFIKEYFRRRGKLRRLWLRDKEVFHLQRFTGKQLKSCLRIPCCSYRVVYKNHFVAPVFTDVAAKLKPKGEPIKAAGSKNHIVTADKISLVGRIQETISITEMRLFGRIPAEGVYILIEKK